MSAPVAVVVLWILIACIGRVVLSFFPPGRPGYHELRELPLTWAASYLLAGVVFSVADALLPAGRNVFWIVAAACALLLVIRWITLPGRMVPRHDVRSERGGAMARVLGLGAVVLVLWPWNWRGGIPGTKWAFSDDDPPTLLALILVLAYGLKCARRAPLGRAAVLLALAGFYAWRIGVRQEGEAVWFGAGAAFAIPWLRRADRRARTLAIVFFSFPSMFSLGGIALGAACLAALTAMTPAPSRTRTAIGGALTLSAFALLGLRYGWPEVEAGIGSRTAWIQASTFAAVVTGLVLIGAAVRRLSLRDEPAERAEHPQRELGALGLALALGLFAAIVCPVWSWSGRVLEGDLVHPALMPLVPIVALTIGLVAVPGERAGAGA